MKNRRAAKTVEAFVIVQNGVFCEQEGTVQKSVFGRS